MTFTPRATMIHTFYALAGIALLGCNGGGDAGGGSGGGSGSGTSGTRTVSVEFAARSGADPVSCDSPITALGTGALQSSLKDLRFYVANVRLIDGNGAEVPLTLSDNDNQSAAGVTLIDLENAAGSCSGGTQATNNAVTGTVPMGNYVGMAMTVGVPAALNHSDYATAARPLDLQAMAWSWQSGRKFMKVEVDPVGGVLTPGNPAANPPTPDAVQSTFNFHLGSTGCTGNPATGEVVNCLAPNRVELRFANFDTNSQRVVLDLQQLFLQSNLSSNQAGAVGCMSGKTDPECQAIFSALGLDIGTGLPAGQGAGQGVFRAEAK